MTDQISDSSATEPSEQIGRNEPCPCGSGKKYKRCCGISAAPKLSAPRNQMPAMTGMGAGGDGPAAGIPGMDQFDPQMMMQFSQMLARLPKGQMQKLQGLMQRAMAGKDVSRDAAALEASLPVDMQQMLRAFQIPGTGSAGATLPIAADASEGGMSEEEARRIVAEAAKKGEISQDQASEVLTEQPKNSFWKKLTGK